MLSKTMDQKKFTFLSILIGLLLVQVQSFAPLNNYNSKIMHTKLFRNSMNKKMFVHSSDNLESSSNMPTRKEFLVTSGVLSTILNQPAFAQEDTPSNISGSKITGPITIIGSNGKTGSECVGVCLSKSIPVRATTRSGVYSGVYAADETNSLLSMMPCDVTLPDTIPAAVEGSRAVIFAASASKQGGTPNAVDNEGLVNVAKACIAAKVPSLVIVSSGAVTKPDSPVYKFLNLFGKIMEEKIKGEDSVRKLYQGCDSSCTYTIIRPGGLTEEEGKGVLALELNQGDTKSGRIARTDVASLCVESTIYPQLTGATTFECYDADTGKPLATVGMSNIMKAKNKADDVVFTSGKERKGQTWEELFTGLEKDVL